MEVHVRHHGFYSRALLTLVLAFSANVYAQQLDSPTAIIKADYANRPQKLFGGYPLCEDLLARRRAENADLVKAKLGEDPELLARFLESDTTFPSKRFFARSGELSEELIHDMNYSGEIAMLRARRSQASSNYRESGWGCFTGEAKLEVLRPVRVDRNRQQSCYDCHAQGLRPDYEMQMVQQGWLRLDEVQESDYVLSSIAPLLAEVNPSVLSPAAMDGDARHLDCWSKVDRVYRSFVHPGEIIDRVTIADSNRQDTFQLNATPMHRFFTADNEEAAYGWLPAEKLLPGQSLYGGDNSDKCSLTVEEVRPYQVPAVRSLEPADDTSIRVYNLGMGLTNVYYIGDGKHRVLVHNIKIIF